MSSNVILKIQRANKQHEQLQVIWDQVFQMEMQEVTSDLGVMLSEIRTKVEIAQGEVLKTGRQWLNKK